MATEEPVNLPSEDPPARGQRASVWDVANAAGVSQKTVSRVLNDAPNVRPEVRERVRAVVAELGYRPNGAARALVTRRTHSVGMVSVGGALLGPAALVDGAERALRARGYSLTLQRTSTNEPGEVATAINDLLAREVEGIIVSEPAEAVSKFAMSSDVPVLVLEDQEIEAAGWLVAAADTAHGAFEATSHLLDLGHPTVQYVGGPEGWGTSATRERGWRAALLKQGRSMPEPLTGDWSARSGFAAGQILAALPSVTAVLAANDEMAIGVIHAFENAGLRVPDDVSVIGMDDAPIANYLHTPLTTVRIDFNAVASIGTDMLLTAIEGEQVLTRRALVPTRLVSRGTTARPGRERSAR